MPVTFDGRKGAILATVVDEDYPIVDSGAVKCLVDACHKGINARLFVVDRYDEVQARFRRFL